jgi:hypothetical protein
MEFVLVVVSVVFDSTDFIFSKFMLTNNVVNLMFVGPCIILIVV